jgi:hypothetical protein
MQTPLDDPQPKGALQLYRHDLAKVKQPMRRANEVMG